MIHLLLNCLVGIYAQQINASGGTVEKDDFSAEWIIGGSLIDNSVFDEYDNELYYNNESDNQGLIELNPTVTGDFIHIKCNNVSSVKLNYKITNASGFSYLAGDFNVNTPFLLDVRGFAAGYYFIIFSSTDDNILITKKFIKL